MWLGKNLHKKDKLFEFQWPQRPVLALGTAFSYNFQLCEQENFSYKLIKIKKLFNVWSQRDLSLNGKITIAKTLKVSDKAYFHQRLSSHPALRCGRR